MAFPDRLRKGLGIGATTIEVTTPDRVLTDAGQVECDIVVTAGAAQTVTDSTAQLPAAETRAARTPSAGAEQSPAATAPVRRPRCRP